jgi:hypothetical protein
MVTITNVECKALSIPEKVDFVKEVHAQPPVTHTKVVEQRSIPVLPLD